MKRSFGEPSPGKAKLRRDDGSAAGKSLARAHCRSDGSLRATSAPQESKCSSDAAVGG